MKTSAVVLRCVVILLIGSATTMGLLRPAVAAPGDAPLPPGVTAVWDLGKAYRETTPTRERMCINGLWRWQPARGDGDGLPAENWGYFKVPGAWPGITDYLQKDCQRVFAHAGWEQARLREITAAWYQREIIVPATWAGRRITLEAEYINSYAVVYLDGQQVGDMRFPAGELDISSVCRLGEPQILTVHVVALPLQAVMMSFDDTASAKSTRGSVARRGLCEDVYLVSTPAAARIGSVKVDTSVWQGTITIATHLHDLDARRRPRSHVVWHRGLARLAVRQSRQRRVGSDREAGARRFPATAGWGL